MGSGGDEDESTQLLQHENEYSYPLGDITNMYIYTTDLKSMIDHRPPYKVSLFLFSLISACSGFLFGWDQGVMGGAILLLVDAFHVSNTGEAIIVSAALFSAVATTMIAGNMTDKFGRKMLILMAYLLYLIGYVITCFSVNFVMFVCGRMVFGLGLGSGFIVVPLYISEAASSQVRGGIVTLFGLGFAIGLFIGNLAAGAVSGITEGWRWLYGSMIPVALLLFFGYILLPESPQWLYFKGRHVKAFLALKMLRPNRMAAYREIKDLIKADLTKGLDNVEMKNSNDIGGESKNSGSDINGDKRQDEWGHAPKALLLGCSLFVCTQVMGVSVMQYFITDILRFVGFDQTSAIWLGVAVSAMKLTSTIFGVYHVDNLGRRPLLLWSISAAAISLVAMAGAYAYAIDLSAPVRVPAISDPIGLCDNYEQCVSCLSNKDCGICYKENYISCVEIEMISNTITSSQCPSSKIEVDECPGNSPNVASWLVFATLCMFAIAVAPGISVLNATINSEIHPVECRGSSSSIAVTINFTMSFVMCLTFLFLVNTIGGPILLLMYSALGAIFFLFFYMYLPETKKKSIEAIEDDFNDKWGKAKNDDEIYIKTPLVIQSFVMMSIILAVIIVVMWRIFVQP